MAEPDLPVPYTYKRYYAKNKSDDDKVAQALAKIMQEDLTMKAVNDSENRQTLLYGMGDQHLELIISKILTKYKIEVELVKPKVAFRETLRKNADVEAKYKKQSGGHGQYGHVKMRFEPSGDLDKPYVFEQEVVGGAVPEELFPGSRKRNPGSRSARTSCSLSGCRRKGCSLRWILPSGRFFRDGFQDGSDHGLQERLYGSFTSTS